MFEKKLPARSCEPADAPAPEEPAHAETKQDDPARAESDGVHQPRLLHVEIFRPDFLAHHEWGLRIVPDRIVVIRRIINFKY